MLAFSRLYGPCQRHAEKLVYSRVEPRGEATSAEGGKRAIHEMMTRYVAAVLIAVFATGCASRATKYRQRLAESNVFNLNQTLGEAADNPVAVESHFAGKTARFFGRVRDIGLATVQYQGNVTTFCSPIYGSMFCSQGQRKWSQRKAYVVLEAEQLGVEGALGCEFAGSFFSDPGKLQKGTTVTLGGTFVEMQKGASGSPIIVVTDCALPE